MSESADGRASRALYQYEKEGGDTPSASHLLHVLIRREVYAAEQAATRAAFEQAAAWHEERSAGSNYHHQASAAHFRALAGGRDE